MFDLKPTDLPAASKIEVVVENGRFTAFLYLDAESTMCDGEGAGDTIEAACRAALQDTE